MKSLWFILLTIPILGQIWNYEDMSGIPPTPGPGACLLMVTAVFLLPAYRSYKYEHRRRCLRVNLATVLGTVVSLGLSQDRLERNQ